MPTLRMLTTVAAIALLAARSHGQAPSPVKKLEITPAMQNTLDEWKKKAQVWADNPVIVAAVTEQNKIGPVPSMTKRLWKLQRRSSKLIQQLCCNPAAKFLQKMARASGGAVSEAFVSAAKGEKVAFLQKTTSYIHTGKSKFDVPFEHGRLWQGKPEFDESTQTYQVQISAPVRVHTEVEVKDRDDKDKDKDKPGKATVRETKTIGVLVIGIDVSWLCTQAKPGK